MKKINTNQKINTKIPNNLKVYSWTQSEHEFVFVIVYILKIGLIQYIFGL